LVGKRAARDAYGTRVQVSAGGKTWHRWISASEGYLCQNSRILHIGLGDVSAVDEVQIHWLGQPEPQVVTAPEINTVVEIVQE
jgi:hypothetical protein